MRFALGNGMRPEVWREFLSRFGNIQIAEFYGATEGNFFLLNYSGKIGAVGRDFYLHRVKIPQFTSHNHTEVVSLLNTFACFPEVFSVFSDQIRRGSRQALEGFCRFLHQSDQRCI